MGLDRRLAQVELCGDLHVAHILQKFSLRDRIRRAGLRDGVRSSGRLSQPQLVSMDVEVVGWPSAFASVAG
jgi:hypothetical protein